jgi:hypothetical protein
MKSAQLFLGLVLVLIAAVVGTVCFTHRPSEGLIEAVKRLSEGSLRPWAFYSLAVSTVLLGIAGIGNMVAGLKSQE